ncbi:efflux RND transporter permease subunit [Verticiella sediminum]|uniref:Efflux RND transporter permease subunit n=1 Tax=Verticiella sediminum TaxID=1247510 RepID=A0A556ABL3_9BURK|nr:efflux RND transporter permease subunit [Verticiella sediminum]TSH90275.1 efflux RND transporter permease subunit [Verticiella sediminum]
MSAHRFNLSYWALSHQPLIRYLMVVLLLAGAFSYTQLGQDEDPPFTFRVMVVRVWWPGATAEQVAEQVSERVERALQQVPWADKIVSYTKPGQSVTILNLDEATPPRLVEDLWYKARKHVNDIAGTLPQGVVGPHFLDEFGDTYGVIFAFGADGFGYGELKDYVEDAQQQLLRVPDVAKVEIFGAQDEKLYVELSSQRLSQFGLSVQDLAEQLQAQNALQASGVLTLPQEQLTVRISGEVGGVDDLRQLPVRVPQRTLADGTVVGGATLRLGDVASISRGYVDPPSNKMRHGTAAGSREVIGLGVVMRKGGNIQALGQALDEAQRRILAGLPVGIEMVKVSDQPQTVKESISEFVKVLAEAVVIVLIVSFLSLGLHTRPLRVDVRPGLVVALTIPLVLASTFLFMEIFGINLHKISLGALIIALGLLVDDAIIAVEMMVRKLEEGHDRLSAAIAMYETTAFPMLTGTLITAAGFLPIAMAKSAAGEYTFSIFAVTALALLLSWFAAVIFTPFLGYWLLRTRAAGSGEDGHHEVFDTPFYRRLRRLIEACMRRHWLVIGITVLALAAGVLSFRFIEQQFFPESNRPELMVDLWLPEGASYAATEAQARELEQWLSAQPEVASYITYVGIGSPRFYLPLDQQFDRSNLAQFVVTPHGIAERNALRGKLDALFAEHFPQARARVQPLSSGPPVAYPVQFRVTGADPREVRRIADEVRAIVYRNPNTRGVNDNWNNDMKILRLALDQDKARALGVSTSTLQQATQMLLAGVPIGTLREDDKLIDIVLRQPADERTAVTRLAEASVPTALGRYVPLSQLVEVSLAWEPAIIWRYNRDYAITVQAEVRDGIQGQTVSTQIDPQLAAIRAALPPGYAIAVAGAAEESGKAQQSIVVNLPLMLFIVMTLLMLQLHSFARATMVYLTGPLGIIGAAIALLVSGQPFGFVAQLGVISLLGMIIRNSVILVDQVERNKAEGHAPWEAVVESAVRRARPIMLTAAAAVLAMIPLTRTGFWGPMAVSIMGGLIVATVLTLLFLPALYVAVFRVREEADAPGVAVAD